MFIEVNENFENDNFKGFDLHSETSVQMSDDELEALVTLHLELGEKGNEYPFYIICDISSEFNWDESIKEIRKMLSVNAPALLLSYVRPYISLLTSATEYPAFNIPFINFKEENENPVE